MKDRGREVKGALVVLVLALMAFGAYRAYVAEQWIKESLMMARDAYGTLAMPVMVDDQRMLLVTDGKGQQLRVPIAQVLQLLANERGRALAEAQKAKQADVAASAPVVAKQ